MESNEKTDDEEFSHFDGAHDALNKMRRAYLNGTGTRLTASEIDSLAISIVGQLWDDPDPRDIPNTR